MGSLERGRVPTESGCAVGPVLGLAADVHATAMRPSVRNSGTRRARRMSGSFHFGASTAPFAAARPRGSGDRVRRRPGAWKQTELLDHSDDRTVSADRHQMDAGHTGHLAEFGAELEREP